MDALKDALENPLKPLLFQGTPLKDPLKGTPIRTFLLVGAL